MTMKSVPTDLTRLTAVQRAMALAVVVLALATGSAHPADASQYTSLEAALKNPLAVKSLILNKVPLAALPPEIGKLENLQALILNRNGLTTIPAEISSLKSLRAVYIGGSPELDFYDVIEKLASLPQLEGVGIDDNSIGKLPLNINKLKACKRLGLSSNKLQTLPAELGGLVNLEALDLYNNRLKGVPEIASLTKLRKIFVKDSGLSETEKTHVHKMLPDATLIEDVPPEVYLQLK